MNEKSCKHYVWPQTLAWEINMNIKMQSNYKVDIKDKQSKFVNGWMLKHAKIPFIYKHFCKKLWTTSWKKSCAKLHVFS